MLKPHFFDPSFKLVSKDLKRYLEKNKDTLEKNICIDAPSGNGRNSFFLSTFFDIVYVLDINTSYLEEISNFKSKYKHKNIISERADLLENIPEIFKKADFICISHFYNKKFFSKLKLFIKKMLSFS